MARPHTVHQGTDNVFIAVPRNLFVLLVVGVLIIAAILAYQFVLVPAQQAAAIKAAEMKAAAQKAAIEAEALKWFKEEKNRIVTDFKQSGWQYSIKVVPPPKNANTLFSGMYRGARATVYIRTEAENVARSESDLPITQIDIWKIQKTVNGNWGIADSISK